MFVRAAVATTAAVAATALLQSPLPAQAVEPAPRAGIAADVDVIAHRGASGYAPENTLAAVDKAAELGAEWVENDVQRTKDGELVVLHDTDLKRTTDAEQVFPDRTSWQVADMTAAQIRRLDAGSWFGPEFAGARVPTLAEYLDRVEANGQNLLLETKSPDLYPGIERDLVRVLKANGWLDREHVGSRLVVQSFDAKWLRTLHSQSPALVKGFLGTPTVSQLSSYAGFADQINPSYTTVDADWVKAVHDVKGAHGKPLTVSAWTVNDAAAAERVAGYGADGIITNYPDRVADAVGGE